MRGLSLRGDIAASGENLYFSKLQELVAAWKFDADDLAADAAGGIGRKMSSSDPVDDDVVFPAYCAVDGNEVEAEGPDLVSDGELHGVDCLVGSGSGGLNQALRTGCQLHPIGG